MLLFVTLLCHNELLCLQSVFVAVAPRTTFEEVQTLN